jgi:hypothetical protein
MTKIARSIFSDEPESLDAGRQAAEELLAQFGSEKPKVVLVYATMNHDQPAVLRGIHSVLGSDVPLLGCSVQGVVSNEHLTEDGFAVGLMGLGGNDVECAVALEREVQEGSRDKGCQLARALKRKLGHEPKAIVLIYDPLCGADVESILEGVRTETDCAIVGGAAGQPWGHPHETFQYWNTEVCSHGLLGLAIAGPFALEIGFCHGTSPSGIVSVITKAVGNQLLELDGRPAGDVWRETTGCHQEDLLHQSHFATWALGVERKGPAGQVERLIRGAFGIDPETGAITLQAAVPEGTHVMLQHRTIEQVLGGTEEMARDLAARLADRKPWAVFGFECAARTFPFLGEANTRKEHENLRAAVAPLAPWLGMMAWGEIGPCAGRPAFHNYSYPLLVLTDEKG